VLRLPISWVCLLFCPESLKHYGNTNLGGKKACGGILVDCGTKRVHPHASLSFEVQIICVARSHRGRG
jgi:hypothetical protein